MRIRWYLQAIAATVQEILGEVRWSLEMTLALSPIGRWVAERNPHIRDMRIFGAALIMNFERG